MEYNPKSKPVQAELNNKKESYKGGTALISPICIKSVTIYGEFGISNNQIIPQKIKLNLLNLLAIELFKIIELITKGKKAKKIFQIT